MDLSNIPSSVLQHILIVRAMKRTDLVIEQFELALARLRLKQAARAREIARQQALKEKASA